MPRIINIPSKNKFNCLVQVYPTISTDLFIFSTSGILGVKITTPRSFTKTMTAKLILKASLTDAQPYSPVDRPPVGPLGITDYPLLIAELILYYLKYPQ